ncbi:uncharacterized protein C4orf54 [Amia ocellicauda]|uniref:uncharacterized protein C4orf54 n=1 Tax=Amia ocellicauda TaxID=2972642 RepID=UPI0034649F6A
MGNNDNTTEMFSSNVTGSRSKRTSIAERTSLCDIFGDESDTPVSLSSTAFIRKDLFEGCRVDDVICDSSGSYHTALCSEPAEQLSDTSENFEDSKEDLCPEDTEAKASVNDDSYAPRPMYITEKTLFAPVEDHSGFGSGNGTLISSSTLQLAGLVKPAKAQGSGTICESGWQKPCDLPATSGGTPCVTEASAVLGLISSSPVSRHLKSNPSLTGKDCSASCKQEQVQLSLTAKNRKMPVSSSTAVTDREPLLGMPGCCYSEDLFSCKQQQQTQQTQQEKTGTVRKNKTVSPSSHGTSVAHSRTPDCTSESSSMGSEFDEADNEVKWFTDLAFKSLSSPQADYLDIYNSSCRSSTNASQPSTEESYGANAWSAYADLQGLGRVDNDDVNLPLERFEMGNFECVDVALESKDEMKRGKRTVPKRQIQLKRRDTSESRASDSSDPNDCKLAYRTWSAERRAQDIFLRQHSTPAAIQDGQHPSEDVSDKNEKKQKLQKSVSLDETSSKAKFASCLIKNVLIKKMQYEHKLKQVQGTVRNVELPVQFSPSVASDKGLECPKSPPVTETSKFEISNLNYTSELKSDGLLSLRDLPLKPVLPGKLEVSNQNVTVPSSVTQHTTVNPKSHKKPFHKFSCNALENSMVKTPDLYSTNAGQGKRSELGIPYENQKSGEKHVRDEAKLVNSNPEKTQNDSADFVTVDMFENTSDIRLTSIQLSSTDKVKEYHTKQENCKSQNTINVFMSKTQDITLKPSSINEKMKTTLKVACLSPDIEDKEIPNSESLLHTSKDIKKDEYPGPAQLENRENNIKNKSKTPMHKVRDVRKLVKNTYNLSFKVPTIPPQEILLPEAEETPMLPTSPPPILTECKAVSRKDKLCLEDSFVSEKQAVTTAKMTPKALSDQTRGNYYVNISPKACETETVILEDTKQAPDTTHFTETTDAKDKTVKSFKSDEDQNSEAKSEATQKTELSDTSAKLRNKECEISTLLFVQDRSNENAPADCLPSSSSHSISIILKEKGFQADIGLCDVTSEERRSTPKHVNTLEVPLQTCVSEATDTEQEKKETLIQPDLLRPPQNASQTAPEDPLPEVSEASAEQQEYSLKCPQNSTPQSESSSDKKSSEDLLYTSDDPPSYDERESFSPLLLQDLPQGKSVIYNPTLPTCTCAAERCPGQVPLPSPLKPSDANAQEDTITVPPQQLPRPQVQDPARPVNFPAGSPQVRHTIPAPPAAFQPPPLASSHFPLQLRPEDRHARQRPEKRATHLKSPQLGGNPFLIHPASPKRVLEARPPYPCSPSGFMSPFDGECSGESLPYAENVANANVSCFQYNQSPRKVLLDPETGKYFYIEVPVQPLRKMLYDPETGQYVEVLIPQQALSHGGLYQSSASPYSSFMNPGMYGSPYMPYSGLSVTTHPPSAGSQPDLPNHMLFKNNSPFNGAVNQNLTKPDSQSNQTVDHTYLESMYYIPTGMTGSPSPAQPEFYQKLPSSSTGGGRRS